MDVVGLSGLSRMEVPLTGPMMVACHWKRLSPIGPAEQEDGGSRPRSMSSWRIESREPCPNSDVQYRLRSHSNNSPC